MRRARKSKVDGQAPSIRSVSASRPVEREVINGITVTVNGRELAVRVGERIRWHRERGDALITQMKKLTEVERGDSYLPPRIVARSSAARCAGETTPGTPGSRNVSRIHPRPHHAGCGLPSQLIGPQDDRRAACERDVLRSG